MPRKVCKIPTKQYLANVALHYVGRYAASEASLRRVLHNRLVRASMAHADFAADSERKDMLRSEIETIIAGYKKNGVLNDAAFATMKINSLRRQGKSRRGIEQKLAAKGIARDLVAEALAAHADGQDAQEVELQAALALARRRKWGNFRQGVADENRRRKDFAALARAGFSSAIARRVLDTEAPEEWE